MEFLALPILIFALYALFNFSAKPQGAVICILLASIIDAWFVVPPSVKIGLNIYIHDAVFILLFISAMVRIIFMGQHRYISPIWAIYGSLLFYSLFVGLKLNGTDAGVDFRNLFYYWSGTLYFMSFTYSKEFLDKIVKYWLVICSILLLIVYFRFFAELIHLPISVTWIKADSGDIRFRVINSGHACLLGISIIMLFIHYLIPGDVKPSKIITAIFVIAIIALQHRSVWAATILAIFSAALLPNIKSSKLLSNILVIGLFGFILMTPILYFGYADKILGMIGKSADRATRLTEGTFGDRVKGWQQILDYWLRIPFPNELFGDPFGGSYAGLKTSPHNFTFQNLLRVGALGTFIFYCFYLMILGKLYLKKRQNRDDNLYSTLFFMLIIFQMAYFIPYGTDPQNGIILGIAASLAKRRFTTEENSEMQTAQTNQHFINTPIKKPLI